MSLTRLLPLPSEQIPLEGTYLKLDLRRQIDDDDILIYANYIASVDGRIALRNATSGELEVPTTLANQRDWRLYQELAAQADVMIVSARYMRQLAKGTAQDLLPVGEGDAFRDLRQWRVKQGLPAQPDVLIVSHSLDIPSSALDRITGRRIIIATAEGADSLRLSALKASEIEILMVGECSVHGMALRRALVQMGYRTAYMIAGPAVHRTLLIDDALDRLFLTTRHCLLGGDAYCTILEEELPSSVHLSLNTMYLDNVGKQHFSEYHIERTYG